MEAEAERDTVTVKELVALQDELGDIDKLGDSDTLDPTLMVIE